MRTVLTVIFGLCLAVFVYIDHQKVQIELSNLDTSQLVVRQQYIDGYRSQANTTILLDMVKSANKRASIYQQDLVQHRETNARFEKVITESAGTIKDLTADNASLQRRLDQLNERYEESNTGYKEIVSTLQSKLEQMTKCYSDLSKDNKKLSDTLSKVYARLQITQSQVQWYRQEYERITGEVSPLPPNSLK